MSYVWILFDSLGETVAVFTRPELAFKSLERSNGVGLVKVIYRGAGLWKIQVKSNGVLRCVRYRVRDTHSKI